MKSTVFALAGSLLAFASYPIAAQTTLGPWIEATNAPAPNNPNNAMGGSVFMPADGSVWSLRSASLGFGGVSATLVASTDQGATWQSLGFSAATINQGGPVPKSGQLPYTLFVLDNLHAWAVVTTYNNAGDTYALWSTATGLVGLAPAPVQPPVADLRGALFFDTQTGLAFGRSGAAGWLSRTTNGGQTWQTVSSLPAAAASATPRDWTQLGLAAWVTLTDGSLLRTPDAGQTWTLTVPPTALYGLAFRDALHGLAFEYSSNYITSRPLYRTFDGGNTWTLVVLAGPTIWNQLATVPGTAGTYLAVGSSAASYGNSSAVISYDDGLTWQSLGGDIVLNGVAAAQANQLWAISGYKPTPPGTIGYPSGTLLRYTGTALPTVSSRPGPIATAYPNPTTGLVRLPAAGFYQQATLYDATGRQCSTTLLQPTETTLNLSGFGAGLYSIRFSGETSMPYTQRLLVLP